MRIRKRSLIGTVIAAALIFICVATFNTGAPKPRARAHRINSVNCPPRIVITTATNQFLLSRP